MIKYLKYILFPFSILYWLYTYCRNVLFDCGILSQTKFSVPVISIGNITVGGTGKTPHVQYIINLLGEKNIAALSRGYKRKSKGFVLSEETTMVNDLGDEPYLLQKRFPNVHVAVCEKRVEGINRLIGKFADLQVIVLDDAFQHRYVKPALQILLVDYNRPLWKDCVFPVGFLREGKYAVNRADAVVVTKCPKELSDAEKDLWRKKLRLKNQKLYFSSMEYGNIYRFSTKECFDNADFLRNNKVFVVTGISQPSHLINYVLRFCGNVQQKSYPDHYSYSDKDIEFLKTMAGKYTMVTTEKDVYKLQEILPEVDWYVVPIMPEILFGEEQQFNKLVLETASSIVR
ncbi:MAG: tetraacyldisaccharide 4'-kinase [Bacteroidales bacterium]|nr:tetraacyldisaccharide 4'-kinase [Bacteroidales bacterium]